MFWKKKECLACNKKQDTIDKLYDSASSAKYTADDVEFFHEVELEKAVEKKKYDKIEKLNAKAKEDIEKLFPIDSVVDVLGVKGFVVDYSFLRNGKLISGYHDDLGREKYLKNFFEDSEKKYAKDRLAYVSRDINSDLVAPYSKSGMNFSFHVAETKDYFPTIQFPSTGNKVTLKGDVLKQAKRIVVK